jgi:hypothetical protein
MDLSKIELDQPFSFARRLRPVDPDLRASWRMPLAVLVLLSVRGQRAGFAKLHLLGWCAQDLERQQELTDYLARRVEAGNVSARVDPFLTMAVDFAVGEGLVLREGGRRFALSEVGLKYAKQIATSKAMSEEAAFLKSVGQRITDTMAHQIMG